MTKWFSASTPEEQARLVQAWPDAPIEVEELCGMLLEVARIQVIEYSVEGSSVPDEDGDGGTFDDPLNPGSTTVPVNLVFAQLYQARNLWNAGRADENGNVGTEGYSFVPRPLDKTVKGIIRPTSGGVDVF